MLLKDKNKRGVSVIVEYILLIVFTIVIAGVVYSFLSSYVPTETVSCQDQVSLSIKDVNYCGNQLNVTVKNNGKFDIAGYSILATNSSSQELATIDLSPYLDQAYGGEKFGNSIIFYNENNNSLKVQSQQENVFTVPPRLGDLVSLELVPVTFQVQNNKNVLARCTNDQVIRRTLSCRTGEIPASCGDGIINGPEICDDHNTASGDGCSATCTVESGYTCSGQPSVCTNNLPVSIFSDNFESYTSWHAPTLYSQMNARGWNITDAHPIKTDDIYLNSSMGYQGSSIVIRDNSNITLNVSTTGYQNIVFSYYLRTYSMTQTNNYSRVSWRVGSSGPWTLLEAMRTDTWTFRQWNLPGGENKPLIQVNFWSDANGNDQYTLVDNINVTGVHS